MFYYINWKSKTPLRGVNTPTTEPLLYGPLHTSMLLCIPLHTSTCILAHLCSSQPLSVHLRSLYFHLRPFFVLLCSYTLLYAILRPSKPFYAPLHSSTAPLWHHYGPTGFSMVHWDLSWPSMTLHIPQCPSTAPLWQHYGPYCHIWLWIALSSS